MTESDSRRGVALAFERQCIVVAVAQLSPLKVMRQGTKASKKYNQILTSVRAIGLVEPPVVIADAKHPGHYFILDGTCGWKRSRIWRLRRSTASSPLTTTPTRTISK